MISLASRLWRRTDRSGECWLWLGAMRGPNYGQIYVGGEKKTDAVHRVAWELTYGPIPPGLYVCHTCDTPLCVRPVHLFLGTHDDNMRDMNRKKRNASQQKTHCRNGHALTPENTYMKPPGWRSCRKCQRASRARSDARAQQRRVRA